MLLNPTFLTPLLSLFAGILIILAIRLFDFIEIEPVKVIKASLIAGAISVIPILSAYNYTDLIWRNILQLNDSTIDNLSTFIDAPIIEESFKLITLFIIYKIFKKEFDTLTDYIVYASSVAVGFSFVENCLYLWGSIEPDSLEGWFYELASRVIDSGGGHIFFSVWLGLGLWLLIETRYKYKIIFAFSAYLTSIMLHLINNLSVVSDFFETEYVPTIIYQANQELCFALFVFLILFSISLDYSSLYNFLFYLQNYSSNNNISVSQRETTYKKIIYLVSPVNILKFNLLDLIPKRFHSDKRSKNYVPLRRIAKLSFSFAKFKRMGNSQDSKESTLSSYTSKGIELIDLIRLEESG